MYDNYRMPKHLDAPPLILFFEADTVLVAAFCVLLGFLFHQLLLFIVVGLVLARLYARAKSIGGGAGTLLQAINWYVLPIGRHPASRSAVREYIG